MKAAIETAMPSDRREFTIEDFSQTDFERAGFGEGCTCRPAVGHISKTWSSGGVTRVPILLRQPVMGCPVHDCSGQTVYIDDPENGGSEAGAYKRAGYDVDRFAAGLEAAGGVDCMDLPADDMPIATVDVERTEFTPFVHGRLGNPDPGRLFVSDFHRSHPHEGTITGMGIAVRLDLPEINSLIAAATGLRDRILDNSAQDKRA